ncbi:MAG TPA: carbohydrate ABC transporter permease [Thermomicrobiales bacterium]|nr:carbohydrate ABC transporter permease [Thermomicrobiales bacterium]
MNLSPSIGRRRLQGGVARVLLYLLFVLFTLIVLIPFYWMVKSALSPRQEIFHVPPTYLVKPTLDNFRTLVNQVPFGRYFLNSLLFSTATTLATLAASFLAAYAIARIPVRGSNVLLLALVISTALPEIVTIIPLYQVLLRLQLLDSIIGLTLIMSSVLAPFTVWVLVAFIRQVPYEVEEAAIVDGARLPEILWRIVLPMTAPALATMAVINFVNAWNNLLYPLAFSSTNKSRTLSLAITEVFQVSSQYGRPWELISSLGVTMMVPVILLAIASQRAIVRGLTAGAIK